MLRQSFRRGRHVAAPPLPAYVRSISGADAAKIVELVESVPLDFGGGCSAAKALVLAELIERFDVRDAIEIGVYRGRSMLPIAEALRRRGAGRVTGIDPWSAHEALQDDDHEVGAAVNAFVRAHPWDQTYAEVLERIEQHRLAAHCTLLRMTSAAAADRIADSSVGLVHVDGNHDREAVEADIRRYEPKLVPGGLLVIDDASWGAVRPIVESLTERLAPVFRLHDPYSLHDVQETDFAVFRIPATPTS